MLTRGDDFPLHQTPEPVAWAGTDRNFYDRYFFNGYAPDGSGFFACALGVYPHLDVIDAHFSVVRDGVQHCLHASREMNCERLDLTIGPMKIEVVEALKVLRITVREADGISAEITFSGRSFPIKEPRFTHRVGSRTVMDYTRMTQNGRYSGWISVDGDRRDVAAGTIGTRDRSWGVRPIGARDQQPIPGAPMPQFFWQWSPLNLENGSLFFHINADGRGNAWNTRAAFAPDGAEAADIRDGDGWMTAPLEVGTRWPSGGRLKLDVDGAPKLLNLEPLGRFQMKGLGYTHPVWGHGMHHGDALKYEREDIVLDQLDLLAPENFHVQLPVRVSGDAQGIGVFEQLVIGPYAPYGLTQFADGSPEGFDGGK